jgi:hypothetical protein
MIESINPQLLFTMAGVLGGGIRGLISYYQDKKSDDIEFDAAYYSDTIIKGAVAGAAMSIGLPINWASLLVAALASAGVDTYSNRLGISIIPALKDYAMSLGDKTKK